MERKIQRQCFVITRTLDATGRFTADLNCDSQPNEIRVKQISYSDNVTPGLRPGSWVIYCDTLVRGPLGCFIDPCVSFTGISYNINAPVRGSYEFRVTLNDLPVTNLVGGHLNIILEFRRM